MPPSRTPPSFHAAVTALAVGRRLPAAASAVAPTATAAAAAVALLVSSASPLSSSTSSSRRGLTATPAARSFCSPAGVPVHLATTTTAPPPSRLAFGCNHSKPLTLRLPHHPPRRSFHASKPAAARIPYVLADIGEGITECEVIQWFVKPGDRIEQFSKICEVQSDKAAVEITSRYDGVVSKLYYNPGDMAKVGSPLVDIESDEDDAGAPEPPSSSTPAATSPAPSSAPGPAATATPAPAEPASDRLVLATPAVRRVAREAGVDLAKVDGSGRNRRVLKEDVIAFAEGKAAPSTASPTPAPAPAATIPATVAAVSASPAGDTTVPLTMIQKAMFKQMTKSLTIPHFGFSDEIIMNNASAYRDAINRYLKTAVPGRYPFKKISYMPIFIKAASLALAEYPILNAKIVNPDDPAKAQLLYRASHNIGIAMDTPNGLLVPNVKDVQTKSILDIAAELERLKELGRRNALGAADLSGGTATLSNIGSIGGTVLHPVLVQSEVCIGAIGRAQRLPRFEDEGDGERVVARDVVAVSWNADHRVIDGATLARFVSLWKSYVENPALMGAVTK